MTRVFTNRKYLALLIVALTAPFLNSVSLAQPPDPPPPPLDAPITGIAIALIILSCVGYGAYNIYKKNYKKAKAVTV